MYFNELGATQTQKAQLFRRRAERTTMKKLIIKTTKTDVNNLYNTVKIDGIYKEYGSVYRIAKFGYLIPESDTYISGLLWETEEEESEHLTLYIEETGEEEAVYSFLTKITSGRRARRLLKKMVSVPDGDQYIKPVNGDDYVYAT